MKMNIIHRHLSTDTAFCRALVGCGFLSEGQMQRAARRYSLGRSQDGGVIFWQIDETGEPRDGKIMYYRADCHRDKTLHPTWVTARLQQHYGYDGGLSGEKCLFGLHLLGNGEMKDRNNAEAVAIVEAEKTAIICSELFPQYLWMAAGGLSMLTARKLLPLCDRRVILFPDTDPEGTAYSGWKAVADEASRRFLSPVYVSPLLELRATPEQKQRKIDIADFIFET